MGVRYTSPNGATVVEWDTHEQCEHDIRALEADPARWTVTLAPIVGDVTSWTEYASAGQLPTGRVGSWP